MRFKVSSFVVASYWARKMNTNKDHPAATLTDEVSIEPLDRTLFLFKRNLFSLAMQDRVLDLESDVPLLMRDACPLRKPGDEACQ